MNTTLNEYKEFLQEVEATVENVLDINKGTYSKDLMYGLERYFEEMISHGIKINMDDNFDIIQRNYNYGTVRFKNTITTDAGRYYNHLIRHGDTTESYIKIIADNHIEMHDELNKMVQNSSFDDVASRTTDDIYYELKKVNYNNVFFDNNAFQIKREIRNLIEKKFVANLEKSKDDIIYEVGVRFNNFKDDVILASKNVNTNVQSGNENGKRLAYALPGAVKISESEPTNPTEGLPVTDVFQF